MTLPKNSEAGLGKSRPDSDRAALEYQEAREFNKRALFIGGCPKSGTTLLMSLLDNCPQLVVLPEETHFLEERSAYLALDNYDAKLRRLLGKQDLKKLDKGWSEPLQEAPSPDVRAYGHFDYNHFVALAESFIRQPGINDSLLFSEMVRAYGIALGADWRNCVRWVEKSTNNEICFDALNELFPEARVIQMMRDPRAVFASRKSRQVKSRGSYTKAHRLVREWNRNARAIPRLRREPSRFLTIRYEDLIHDPRKVLESICHFGGFEFGEKMLEPTRAGKRWQGNSAFHEAFTGISGASVDLWKNELTQQEIWWIEWHCHKGMELAGYPLQSDARFSLSRWLKRLPGESRIGYLHARRASLCQVLGLLKECNYD